MATSDHRDGASPKTDREWHRWQMKDLGQPPSEAGTANRDAEARRYQQQERADEQARLAAAEKARQEGFERGHQEGKAQGYEAGYREGLEAANAAAELEFQKRLDLTLGPLATLAENFRHALTTLDNEVADQLVELALITGRQLAGESLAAKPEHILSVVRELLDADTALTGKPRLWLHPQDRELVTASMGDLLIASGWECHADPTLERGGCRATSAAGGLDASLSTQWKAILDQRRQRKAGAAEPMASDPAPSEEDEPQTSTETAARQSAGKPRTTQPTPKKPSPKKPTAKKPSAAKSRQDSADGNGHDDA